MQTDLPTIPPAEAGNPYLSAALPPVQRWIVLGLWTGLLPFGTVALCPMEGAPENYWPLVWLGMWFAQACLPGVWAALALQPLSVRLPRAMGLVGVLMVATAWASSRSDDRGSLTLAITIPCIGLVILAPLVVVRWLFGWRLTVPEEPRPPTQRTTQFSLRQLLIWMVATAVLLAWAKCVLPDGKTFQEECRGVAILEQVPFAAMGAAMWLPIIISSLGLVLACRNRIWFALGLLIAVSLFAAAVIYFTTNSSPSDWQEEIAQLAILEGSFLSMLLGTLLILRLCGYRLLRRRDARFAVSSPACGVSPPTAERRLVWRTPFPYLVAAILFLGLLAGWPAWKFQAARREANAQEELARPWREVGISPTFEAGRVTELSFVENQPVSEAGLKKLQELGTTSTFHSLWLNNTGLTDDQMHDLSGLRTLASLSLSDTPLTDAGLKHLQKLTNLQRLTLDGTSITGTGFAALVGLPKLTTLRLIDSGITDAGLKQIQRLGSLEELNLDGTLITDAGLAQLDGLPRLISLHLPNTRVTGAGLKHLARLKSLRFLQLNETRVTGAGLAELAGLEGLQGLTLGSETTDEGLQHLPKFKELYLLWLEGSRITDAGLAHLAGLPKLNTLNLPNIPITDAGLKHLASLENLEALWLPGSQITDAGLVHLRALKNLRRLDLKGTQVTEQGLQEFRRAMPGCTIGDGPCLWRRTKPARRVPGP